MKTRLFKSREAAQKFADQLGSEMLCLAWREGKDFKAEAFLLFYDASAKVLSDARGRLQEAINDPAQELITARSADRRET